MTTVFQDVRFAFRQLRKTPAFTVTVLLTLALGIGANAAIFTLVNGVLLSSLPVTDPATLVRVGDGTDCCVNGGSNSDGKYSLFSTETYHYLQKNLPEFEDMAAMQGGFPFFPLTVRRDVPEAQARSVVGEFVSGNYFRTFGLKPVVGRMLTDADDRQGAPMVAIVSYSTWQHNFDGDAGVIGRTLWVNTKAVTIVGVAPKGFFGDRLVASPPEFYLPIESMPVLANATFVHDPSLQWLEIIARPKPGVTITPELQQKVNATLKQVLGTYPDFKGTKGELLLAKAYATLAPGGGGIQFMKEQYEANLKLLMWVAGLVLLIACANIANLLLVRGMERRTEMSVRAALGAQRGRLVRQMLTESVVLSVLGGVAGLAVAYGGAKMLIALAFPGEQAVTINASPSLEVIGFAFALALVTGALFGISPAVMAVKAQPAEALRAGSRTTASGASMLQRGLVILQAALSLVLLVGAGLFAQSLGKLENTDMKLDARNRYIIHFNPQAAGYKTTEVEALYRTVQERFHQIPGVVKVGISTYTPMENNNWSTGVQVAGEPWKKQHASYVKATPEYFDSVGTKVVLGRGIGVQDTSSAPAVAVVNETFVKKVMDGRNPIGMRFGGVGPKDSTDFTIVGVVEDTAYTDVRLKDHSMYFLPMTQRRPSRMDQQRIGDDLSLYAAAIVVETDRPMEEMETAARRTLAGINPNLTVVKFQTFQQQINDRFNNDRLVARLTTLFGGLALLLAAIGLYGVTTYTVVRRTQEIGIRMALGADRGGVVTMILRGAMVQAAVGLAIGIPVALLCVRYVTSQLYEVTKVDARILLGALATLGVAAAVAGLIPAKRAASIDPMEALRAE
ncbi:ABC transporter permease [Edaphobacter sp. HDX4]|uniref:ABC transporter permease n=1 Tax=Edaphobacter sp. HDX4 TaxID=2794064 RepID=UPI002FE62C91